MLQLRVARREVALFRRVGRQVVNLYPGIEQIGYRFGDRKVIAHLLDARAEVYDLAADPAEQRDLAAGNPRLQQDELSRIRGWVRYLDARAAD